MTDTTTYRHPPPVVRGQYQLTNPDTGTVQKLQRVTNRIGILADRPVDPGKAVARRVARHPGIDDDDIVTARDERRLEDAGKGVSRFEAVAGAEAVAEGDDAQRLGARRHCGQRQRDHGKGKGLDRHAGSPI